VDVRVNLFFLFLVAPGDDTKKRKSAKKGAKKPIEELVFDVENNSLSVLRHFQHGILGLVGSIVSSRGFVSKVTKLIVDLICSELVEKTSIESFFYPQLKHRNSLLQGSLDG
jgi:hypothetical protein